jgi:ubiquinone/menaquinone biosynthesis C-methylase UbiE
VSSIGGRLVAQFGNPTGILGLLAGLIMRLRPSNRERNLRSIDLLDIRANDYVLEIGFGPGLAIERAAARATHGKVVGVDHSDLMLRQAARRNSAAIVAGNVELHCAPAEKLPAFGQAFDKVLAVNVFMFWREPVEILRALRRVMNRGATIALTLQPRQRGATIKDTMAVAERMAASLQVAGYNNVQTKILEMSPVAAACVLAEA